MSKEGSASRPYIIAAVAGVLFPLLLLSNDKIEPLWLFLGISLLALMVLGMFKFPAAYLVPVIFIPQFKDMPSFQSLPQHVDLTVMVLILLLAVVLFHFLFALTRMAEVSASQLFIGQGKGIAAFFLFAAIVAASYLYTDGPSYGWVELSRLWGIGGLLFVSPLVLVKNESDFRHFVIAFLGAAIFLGIRLVMRLQFLEADEATDITKIGAGWLMAMAILLVAYYLPFDGRVPRVLLALFCLPLFVAGLVASASRGAILSLVLALGLTSLMIRRRKRIGLLLIVILMMATGVVSFYFLRHAHEAKYEWKIFELQETLRGSPRGTSAQRLAFFTAALRGISEKPVLGLGVGGWSVYYYGRDVKGDPHNLLLQVAVEQGLLGLIVFLAFLWTVALAIRRIVLATGEHFVVLFSLVVYVLATSMVSGDLDDDRVLWFLCSMAFAVSRMVRVGTLGSLPGSASRQQLPQSFGWLRQRQQSCVES